MTTHWCPSWTEISKIFILQIFLQCYFNMWLQEATGLDGYKSWMALGIFLGHNRVLSQCNIQQHCVTSYQDIMTKTCDKTKLNYNYLHFKNITIFVSKSKWEPIIFWYKTCKKLSFGNFWGLNLWKSVICLCFIIIITIIIYIIFEKKKLVLYTCPYYQPDSFFTNKVSQKTSFLYKTYFFKYFQPLNFFFTQDCTPSFWPSLAISIFLKPKI